LSTGREKERGRQRTVRNKKTTRLAGGKTGASCRKKHLIKTNIEIVEVTMNRKMRCRDGQEVRFIGTHKVLYKIPHRIHAEIPQEVNLQPVEERYIWLLQETVCV
jgi:hypothetical protein